MRVGSFLQEHFGFTRNEIKVVLFLSTTFLAGLCLRWYNSASPSSPPEAFDLTQADSEFIARSMAIPDSGGGPARGAQRHMRSQKPSLQPHSIDLNTASQEQLMQLPGIGAGYALRILRYRSEEGRFRNVNDLLKVRGIGPKKLERLRPFVAVR